MLFPIEQIHYMVHLHRRHHEAAVSVDMFRLYDLQGNKFQDWYQIVIGDENESNSVGKSTFLMILDFVFSGKDYVNKWLVVR